MTPVYWIVMGRGDIVGAWDMSCSLPEKNGVQLTNLEIGDERGQFWSPFEGSLLVSSDGSFGRLCQTKELADSVSRAVVKEISRLQDESADRSYSYYPGVGLMAHMLLTGLGSAKVCSSFAQQVIRVCVGSGRSMASIMGEVEEALEKAVEDAMATRNSCVDEQGCAKELWWAGWEKFKRKVFS